MKRLIVLSVIMAVMLLTWASVAPVHPQDSAKDDTPTFYHLVPGTYVNGWPRCTIHYPKDWIERPGLTWAGQIFLVSPREPVPGPQFSLVVSPLPLPLEKFAETLVPVGRSFLQEVTIVSDKPVQLRDGSPAREVEIRGVWNGTPVIFWSLATKKGDVAVHVDVTTMKRTTVEYLKTFSYSLEFEPGKDEPVKVPSDVQGFLDSWRNDVVSHDVAKVMTHYSDRYLNSGEKKGEVERFWRWMIGSVTSINGTVTDFVPAGDKAYLAGFVTGNFGIGTTRETSIIKENGEWKWYGNQREVVP